MQARLENPTLARYMELVEDTESPRDFHIWALLSGISAAMGRRVFFPFGEENLWPNQYVWLVGPPAVRKSTAIKTVQRMLREATGVRFAPDDTNGQRQGLIAAITGSDEEGSAEDEELQAALASASNAAFLEALGNRHIDTRDRHHIYVCASELSSVLGQNQLDLCTFLVKMYDSDPYDYRLKASRELLEDALVNMIGGTTPASIASTIHPSAIGHGFMSRIILVYGAKKYKMVARPQPFNESLRKEFTDLFEWVYTALDGPMVETNEAAEFINSSYMEGIKVEDPRFIYYTERRHTHLIKVSMAMAATRRSNVIELIDVVNADTLLKKAERSMPEALGEFGMSPLAAAKQKMLDFIRTATSGGAIPQNALWAVMQRDMKQVDFINCLSDLLNAGKIVEGQMRGASGEPIQCYMFRSERQAERDSLADLLVEG